MNNIVLSKLSIIIMTIAAIIGGYYLIGKLIILLMPFIIGLLISKLINPAVGLLHSRLRVPRGITTLILLFAVIFGIGFAAVSLGGFLAGEFMELSTLFPIWTSEMLSYFEDVSSNLDNVRFGLPGTVSTYITTGMESMMSKLGELSTFLGSKLLSAVTSVPNILFFIVIMFVSAFFMTKDKERIDGWLNPIFRGEWTKNEKVQIIRSDVFGVLWGYVKAQLILMSLTFVESAIGLTLIGVSYPIPIALGIALIDALPILGPATIYIPWVISKIVIGKYVTAMYLFILYLFVTLARQALEPKILSTQIGIYPLVTLLSMYIGLKLLGVVGIILGPVTIITLLSLFKTGILPKPKFVEQNTHNTENNSD